MTTDTTDTPQPTRPRMGIAGFVLGGLALLVVVISFVGGPFAPQNTVGVTLGDIAAEAGKATLRNWLGMEQPGPEPVPWTIDRTLWLIGVVLGVIATLCGAAALLLRERRDIALWALGLGISAVALQFVASALMLIVGAMILCALIYSFGDFLSFG
ncbi:hypothetical protein [uncultured Tateyamaria sp.]|uniref:hypothetical protein n=1 Tax=uncultured Tateyamaria sp. TaxID=455651 RepID=UPI0026324BD2|nr:hypothetical protein [uncultured Tateyamaria sp.]